MERYCNLSNLPVDEQKFCYDIDPIKQELERLLEYGADEIRICKKVKSINPDFCKSNLVISSTSISSNEHKNLLKKTIGVIYE